MSMITRGSIVMVLLMAAFVPAAGAGAQSPERIVRRCVAELRQTVAQTQEAVQVSVRRGSAGLIAADGNGATDEELTGAADRAKARVRQIGERALTVVGDKAARCLRALNETGGTEEQAAAILAAAENASGAIRAAVERGQNRIQQVLERLLG